MISVIVPVYNASSFLVSSVTSIFSHNLVSEIILIDDGSVDNSLDICYQLRDKDSRVVILFHLNGGNRGAAESRNLGIKHAKFPYIAFLDSDDLYFDNRFDLAMSLLESNLDVDGCYGKVLVNYIGQQRKKLMGPPSGLQSKELFPYLLNGGYFHTNSLTVRKTLLENLGGFDQRCWPHEDVELWTRLAYYGKFESIPSEIPIAEYKIHGKNLSQIGNYKSKLTLWKTVFANFFFKSISFKERYFILKQLSKIALKRLLNPFLLIAF